MATLDVDITFERKNNGIKIEDLKAYLKSLEGDVLTVGVHKDKGNLTVKKAAHTEFGSAQTVPVFPNGWVGKDIPQGFDKPYGFVGAKRVPPRPAIRMYLYQDMKDRINTEYQLAIGREKSSKFSNPSMSADKTLKTVGQECVFMQREKMALGGYDQSTNDTGLNPEHNGDRTVKYKGFDDPWIQTGGVMSTVDYKVEKRV